MTAWSGAPDVSVMPTSLLARALTPHPAPARADGLAVYEGAALAMDTAFSAQVAGGGPEGEIRATIERALAWPGQVERACSRFDPESELRRLLARVGEPVRAGPLLFEALRFALALAAQTGGAFDPTIGRALEALGFDRHWVTGVRTATEPSACACAGVDTRSDESPLSYRDVRLDPRRRTITLARRLVLDLGAIGKGLAIDLMARELDGYASVCIDAGGDLFAKGSSGHGGPWRVGVRHPRVPDELACAVEVPEAGGAVCTSGDYERRATGGDGAELGHHILDPRSGRAADGAASVTMCATTALAADGLATAAFVLGPTAGRRLLQRSGAAGIFLGASGGVLAVAGLTSARGAAAGRRSDSLPLFRSDAA